MPQVDWHHHGHVPDGSALIPPGRFWLVIPRDELWSTYIAVERVMPRTNLTLQLDEDVIRRARVVAAKRGTSVSALTAQTLLEIVQSDERYEAARARGFPAQRRTAARRPALDAG